MAVLADWVACTRRYRSIRLPDFCSGHNPEFLLTSSLKGSTMNALKIVVVDGAETGASGTITAPDPIEEADRATDCDADEDERTPPGVSPPDSSRR
jgi:hypothetical protein